MQNIKKLIRKPITKMCKKQEKDSTLQESLNEKETETLQLIEDEDGSELCYCIYCGCYYIDNNPQFDAKKYNTDIARGELKLFSEPTDEDSPDDEDYFWGCPECETDEYLIDV